MNLRSARSEVFETGHLDLAAGERETPVSGTDAHQEVLQVVVGRRPRNRQYLARLVTCELTYQPTTRGGRVIVSIPPHGEVGYISARSSATLVEYVGAAMTDRGLEGGLTCAGKVMAEWHRRRNFRSPFYGATVSLLLPVDLFSEGVT